MKFIQITLIGLLFCVSLQAEVTEVLARATAYHKDHRHSDSDTKAGRTSTKISLRDNCDYTIGMVAVDPKKIPWGSLVFSPENGRFYLACDVGDAVVDRDAAKETAEKHNLPKKYHDALVLDFYSRNEITDDDYAKFIVVKHDGDRPFWKLYEEYQEKRLEPSFWIARVEEVLQNRELKNRDELKEMLRRLERMDRLG